MTWEVKRTWFDFRATMVFFHVILPFADERSWRLKGEGRSREVYAHEHPSNPLDFITKRHVSVGMQTNEEITGRVPEDNVTCEVAAILNARASAGLPRQSVAERKAETRRIWREKRRERKRRRREGRMQRALPRAMDEDPSERPCWREGVDPEDADMQGFRMVPILGHPLGQRIPPRFRTSCPRNAG